MKIITWNCNMAFRKKINLISELRPDIAVVPECEHPDRLRFDLFTQKPTDVLWHGDNHSKGLGVFSFGANKFTLLDNHNKGLKTILPISITGGKVDFILFAIWANNTTDKKSQYIGQVWKAIHYYEGLLNEKVILTGDFNSNTIWDNQHRQANHSAVVKKLEEKRIYSAYHIFYKQEQGKEQHPTFFTYRHKDKPYHIDYCFASDYFISRLKEVQVGSYEQWTRHSDHKPVIVTFDLA